MDEKLFSILKKFYSNLLNLYNLNVLEIYDLVKSFNFFKNIH
jgi:hypothetical protein